MADESKAPAIVENQKRFEHPRFEALVLVRSAEELYQEDIEAWMQAYQRSQRGSSVPEYNGKVIEAAIVAGWIESPQMTVVDGRLLVNGERMRPPQVRFYAECVDAVYGLAMNPPAK